MAAKTETIHQQTKQGGIPQPHDRAARLPEVLQLTGKSKTTLYEDIRAGRFPAGFRIGKRARAWWLNADVMAWLETRKAGGVQ
ncbi:AlpA family phage regulatory protein [Candidatus Thiothrix sp. Deng01]|uniref:AlpA family phage regulatory protein n=1 Tax=Candidatus Thiothrix phosphatis TaxID=3112415 RepID=A0ABU6CYR3_9GAMM|nr:AlpA family phage regulatory protein [Candidatus Thiothrix sp. Deng01]MEB4591217.1 AlpA family phage regulatory protein [Candidatus Thiothrix sp. Deng01]